MSKEETYEIHRERHIELHKSLDELVADFISDKENKVKLLEQTTIMELLYWSYKQTLKEKGEENGRNNRNTGKGKESNE